MTPPAESSASPLIQWAEAARELHDVADSLCRSSFVPSSFKKDGKNNWRDPKVVVSEVVAAILAGSEVGLQPLAALRSIQLVAGTPALTALAQRGLVQSQGHEVWVDEQTDTKAVVRGQRKGSDRVQTSTWTIERARKMQLTSKTQWTLQPQAMLVARASAEVCRLIASDVLLGLPYAAEELHDQDDTDAPPAPSKARRRPLAAAAETPAAEAAPAEPQPTGALLPGEDLEPDLSWPEITPPGADAS